MRYTYMQVLVWSLLTTTVLCLFACQSERHEQRLSAYYWSTVFDLDSAQRAFIHNHHIGRIYLRMFDVVPGGGRPMPNASVQVLSPRPDSVEVVPTVFIINDCLLAPQQQFADGRDNKDGHDIAVGEYLQRDVWIADVGQAVQNDGAQNE